MIKKPGSKLVDQPVPYTIIKGEKSFVAKVTCGRFNITIKPREEGDYELRVTRVADREYVDGTVLDLDSLSDLEEAIQTYYHRLEVWQENPEKIFDLERDSRRKIWQDQISRK